jgi:hypothetical protein
MEKFMLSVFTEFASGGADGLGFYRFPIQSNKFAPDFFSFYRYTGDTYKAVITRGLLDIMAQEMSRMQTVRMRNRKKGDKDYIKNWDERGRNFAFLRFLNNPVLLANTTTFTSEEANTLHRLIEDKVNGKEVDSQTLANLAKKAINAEMDRLTQNMMNRVEKVGISELM